MKKNSEFEEIVSLIGDAKTRAFQKVNEELVLLYFKVGSIVSKKVATGIWGNNTVNDLSEYIKYRYNGLHGFSRPRLYSMKQFYETYTSPQFISALPNPSQHNDYQPPFVSALPRQFKQIDNTSMTFALALLAQISWTNHLLILSKAKTVEEKLFYILTCINDKLSSRELERQLNTAVFERTILSNKKVSPVVTQLRHDLFKDPYIFEFLDLPEGHSEKELEKALILNLRKFILEIGKEFTYMGNQYRLKVGSKDYYTDLLFYHRSLQCLVLFELKIDEFQPEFLGKLNFYLEVLDKDIKRPHENPSIGVLICKEKDNEVVKYSMARNISPAIVAEYETKLIPKKMLAEKLHQLVEQLSRPDEIFR
jgi:predicted nuclease of restriction endonuclease-like (RecB) superfamily